MKVLILGENSSGKSLYAETLISKMNLHPLYYIATMIPYGNEGKLRVEKHREQRRTCGFITIEKPNNVSQISLPQNTIILLEDVSNLLGNSMFESGESGDAKASYEDIAALCAKCRHSVLVSIDGLAELPEYGNPTNGFIKELNSLNSILFGFSDIVIKMRNGIATVLKGDLHDLD